MYHCIYRNGLILIFLHIVKCPAAGYSDISVGPVIAPKLNKQLSVTVVKKNCSQDSQIHFPVDLLFLLSSLNWELLYGIRLLSFKKAFCMNEGPELQQTQDKAAFITLPFDPDIIPIIPLFLQPLRINSIVVVVAHFVPKLPPQKAVSSLFKKWMQNTIKRHKSISKQNNARQQNHN